MKKFFFVATMAALLLGASMSLNASVKVKSDKSYNKDKHIGRFADNWYIQAGGGISTFRDNGNWGHIKPAVAIDLGKWLTPTWGFRLGYQGLTAQASDTSVGWFAGKESFGFHYTHIDWIYNPIGCERRFNISPYIHAGGIITPWNGLIKAEAGVGPGLLLNIRVAGNLKIHADARLILAREETWRASGSTVAFMSATAGLSYAFGWGKKGKVGFENHTREVVVVKELIECTHEAQIAALKAEIDSLRNQPAPAAVEAAPRVFRYSVYFDLNKSNLLDKERFHLKDIMETLKGLDNVSISLSGHADKETGTKRRNRVLSKERVEVVSAYLESLGFNGKIDTASYGDEANPYHDEIPMNRCAVVEIRY